MALLGLFGVVLVSAVLAHGYKQNEIRVGKYALVLEVLEEMNY